MKVFNMIPNRDHSYESKLYLFIYYTHLLHISWYDKGKERRHLMKLENKEQNIVETESENSH